MFVPNDDRLVALARHVARGVDDLASELAQHVRVQMLRGLYDPARGSFDAWARRVMWNYIASIGRRREHTSSGLLPDRADPHDDTIACDLRIDLAQPFSSPDVAAVLRWTARQRAVLLS